MDEREQGRVLVLDVCESTTKVLWPSSLERGLGAATRYFLQSHQSGRGNHHLSLVYQRSPALLLPIVHYSELLAEGGALTRAMAASQRHGLSPQAGTSLPCFVGTDWGISVRHMSFSLEMRAHVSKSFLVASRIKVERHS